MSYIVIARDSDEGYKYYGPYETYDDAFHSIEGMHPNSGMDLYLGPWVAEMLPPLKKS